MVKQTRRRSMKVGLPPGKPLIVTGPGAAVKIDLMDYNEEQFTEREVNQVKECLDFKGKPTVTWVNIDGVTDQQTVEDVCKCFGIHPLTIEDIVHLGQRPKVDEYKEYIYLAVRMLYQYGETKEIIGEQVSIVLGPTYVLSFQERVGHDVFDPVRENLRKGKGRIRQKGADFLAYALIDAIVDNYFLILDSTGDKLETLDEELVNNPTEGTMHTIHNLMRDLIFLQKSLWPLRPVVEHLSRENTKGIDAETTLYFKDLSDHTIQVLDSIDTYMQLLSSMMDTYVSSLSNKMTDVLKVLTIIATVFTPPTFVASIYGMNFVEVMPELHHLWVYLLVWGVMLGMIGGMLFWFWRRGWFKSLQLMNPKKA